MKKYKSLIITSIFCSTISTGIIAHAADEYNTPPGLTAAGAPLALRGVDPVAFIETSNRSLGQAKFASVYQKVTYYFSSEENKAKFEKSPTQYLPQNGGFCTFGVSVGKKFDGDPNYASVMNGKLYVFLNEQIYKMFLKDPEGVIKKAAMQWKKIKHTDAISL